MAGASGRPSRPLAIFLDDAGTITNPTLRAGQLARATAEFLAPRLGGPAAAWEAAHRDTLAELWDEYTRTMFGAVDAAYPPFRRDWLLRLVRGMCARTGAAMPADALALDYALRAEAYATRRVRAAYPGAVAAIRTLHERGHSLHTASSEDSAELEGYLEALGVRDLFDRLYGPDLTGTIKEGPRYYERIFDDAGISPRQALVVDDNPLAIGWAKTAGAHTARIGTPAGDWPAPDISLDRLADLPNALLGFAPALAG